MFGGVAAVDGDRVLFATLDGSVVTLDAAAGQVVDHFSLYPSGPEHARFTSCAVDDDGTILVADPRNHRVRRFRPDGFPVGRYGAQRNPGMRVHDEAGVLDEPYSVLANGRELLVASGGGDLLHAVQRFARSGEYLGSFPNGGDARARWLQPRSVALVEGLVWVAETGASRIRVHASTGRHVGDIDVPPDLGRPLRLADDGYEGVLVVTAAEGGAPGVVRVDRDGEVLGLAVPAGKDRGSVDCAFDVAVMPDGRFVVADLPSGATSDARLQLFRAGGTFERVLVEGADDLRAQLGAFAAELLASGGDDAAGLYRRARAQHFLSAPGRDHAEAAAGLYRAALGRDASHLLARLGLATLLHHALGDPDGAELEYRRAIESGGDEADLLARVAECRHDRGDLDGAIEILQRAVDRPDPPENVHERLEALGNYWLERAGESPELMQ